MTAFLSSFFVKHIGILNSKKAKHFKKKISEELLPVAWHPKRWWNFCMPEDEKKRNQTNFYRVMLLMYAIWEYWNTLTLDIVQKVLWISSHSDTVQTFFLSDFFGTFVPKYVFTNI